MLESLPREHIITTTMGLLGSILKVHPSFYDHYMENHRAGQGAEYLELLVTRAVDICDPTQLSFELMKKADGDRRRGVYGTPRTLASTPSLSDPPEGWGGNLSYPYTGMPERAYYVDYVDLSAFFGCVLFALSPEARSLIIAGTDEAAADPVAWGVSGAIRLPDQYDKSVCYSTPDQVVQASHALATLNVSEVIRGADEQAMKAAGVYRSEYAPGGMGGLTTENYQNLASYIAVFLGQTAKLGLGALYSVS